MINRCIMIIPTLSNINTINEIRNKYDPLSNHVKPHITLVFPFESQIETGELKNHLLSALTSATPFSITLHGISTGQPGNYLFLDLESGKDEISELHSLLYTGLLAPYKPAWLKNRQYYAHMTIGKFSSNEELAIALDQTRGIDEVFSTDVNRVSVEIIDENEDSIIEMEVELLEK